MNRYNRRNFLRLTASAAAGVTLSQSVFAADEDSDKRPPNIIYIMADDLGYGHLGCYGQKKIMTPNIDRLAAEGLRFTDTYAGCTVCAPSRSVLMTGLHTGHTPVRGNSGGIPIRDSVVTTAEVLKQAGYATGGFGKWGLGDAETTGVAWKQGFDEFFGYYHQVHAHFYYPEYLWHNDEKVPLPEDADSKRGQYAHDVILEHALKFILANRDRPFFCYLPVTIPHVELVVPEESEAPYRDRFPRITIKDPRPGYIGSDHAYATYAGMITRLDDGVGRIMALLRKLDLDDNTIVFFTSDNGPQSSAWEPLLEFFDGNGPFRGAKGSLYEGGIRVPMIARWPGRIAAGRTSALPWYFADVMPTFAELAGAEAPEGIDGISVVPELFGKSGQKRHEYLYWEDGLGKRMSQAVRMGDWKAIRQGGADAVELFNLEEDPGETQNVASKHPDIAKKLAAIMEKAHEEPPPQTEPDKPEGRRYL